jgi:hypothetical protein
MICPSPPKPFSWCVHLNLPKILIFYMFFFHSKNSKKQRPWDGFYKFLYMFFPSQIPTFVTRFGHLSGARPAHAPPLPPHCSAAPEAQPPGCPGGHPRLDDGMGWLDIPKTFFCHSICWETISMSMFSLVILQGAINCWQVWKFVQWCWVIFYWLIGM